MYKAEAGIKTTDNKNCDMDKLKYEMEMAYKEFVAKKEKALAKKYGPGNGMKESEYKAVMRAGVKYFKLRQQVMEV